MAKDAIRPSALTLRFKHGKHTILLFAEPNTPFSTIKSELLQTLRERYPDGLPTDTSPEKTPIPEAAIDINLGVPVNTYEPSQGGWTELDTTDLMETPKGVGLKDGSVLAFAFSDDESGQFAAFIVEWSNLDEQYAEEEAVAGEAATEEYRRGMYSSGF